MYKLPTIRLRLSKSRSKIKHTLEQMKICYDAIASEVGLEIDSYQKSLKSIYEKKNKCYIIECKGTSFDSFVIGDFEKTNEIWYNSKNLPI